MRGGVDEDPVIAHILPKKQDTKREKQEDEMTKYMRICMVSWIGCLLLFVGQFHTGVKNGIKRHLVLNKFRRSAVV